MVLHDDLSLSNDNEEAILENGADTEDEDEVVQGIKGDSEEVGSDSENEEEDSDEETDDDSDDSSDEEDSSDDDN